MEMRLVRGDLTAKEVQPTAVVPPLTLSQLHNSSQQLSKNT